MSGFKDLKGRAWSVDLTLGEIRQIRDELDVDLLACLENDAAILRRLFSDVYLVGDCLVVACRRQCRDQGIEVDDFVRSLGGDCLESAHSAFVDALIDFFPPPRREALRKMVDKAREVGRRVQALGMAKIDQVVESIDTERAASAMVGGSSRRRK